MLEGESEQREVILTGRKQPCVRGWKSWEGVCLEHRDLSGLGNGTGTCMHVGVTEKVHRRGGSQRIWEGDIRATMRTRNWEKGEAGERRRIRNDSGRTKKESVEHGRQNRIGMKEKVRDE